MMPWELESCFLGCPVELASLILANPKHRGQDGQTVALQELQ